jgi:UDP-3-O-[3-hydroxymyristoyl] glucosamine N-acyltransferase
VKGVASVAQAGPNDLTFCTAERFLVELANTRAAVVVLPAGLHAPNGAGVIRAHDARQAFESLLILMYPEPSFDPVVNEHAVVHPHATVSGARVDAFAVVEDDACVGPGSWIMAHAYVGAGVCVGADCRVAPHAVLMPGVTLGDRVEIQPGAVLGSRGFGYSAGADGIRTMPHVGTVVVEDDVVIGANSCVDRAPLGATRIGRATKTDNLVQVGHGAVVGAQSLLAAYAGISGSATLGRGVTMGGRAGVVQGVKLGDGVTLGGASTATKDVKDGETVIGFPAQARAAWLRERAWLRSQARKPNGEPHDE